MTFCIFSAGWYFPWSLTQSGDLCHFLSALPSLLDWSQSKVSLLFVLCLWKQHCCRELAWLTFFISWVRHIGVKRADLFFNDLNLLVISQRSAFSSLFCSSVSVGFFCFFSGGLFFHQEAAVCPLSLCFSTRISDLFFSLFSPPLFVFSLDFLCL